MKTSFFAVFAFGSFIASSIANPISSSDSGLQARQTKDYAPQGAMIESLFSSITEQTALINKTVEAAPENPATDEANAAAAQIAPQLQAITALLQATKFAKRDAINGRGDSCDDTCIFHLITGVVWEITCVVKFIVIKLGLACVLVYLTPLVFALVQLLGALDLVVAGVLFAVKEIVNALLVSIGLGVIGIIV